MDMMDMDMANKVMVDMDTVDMDMVDISKSRTFLVPSPIWSVCGEALKRFYSKQDFVMTLNWI